MKIIESSTSLADVSKISLLNDQGVCVSLLTKGATLQEFLVPDQEEGVKNIIAGLDDPADYDNNPLCLGQSIGRVAGRIDGGRFHLGNREYQLPQNEKGNCLHGGDKGFHKQNWDYQIQEEEDCVKVIFSKRMLESVDGFPGDVTVDITYTLDNNNRLTIEFAASEATEDGLFNPTNHVYFNLSKRQDLSSHRLMIRSEAILETREDLVPTGHLLPVEGSVYDFRSSKNLGQAIDENGGFDHAFVVPIMDEAIAVLEDRESGDQLTIESDRNGLVVYTMNEGTNGVFFARDKGKEAQVHEAVALEAQTLPDAINHPGFGETRLRKNESVVYRIRYRYSKGSSD